MIKPDLDPIAFSHKYGIAIRKSKCYSCSMEVEVNIPVITKDWVGFESIAHEPCGERYRISVLKPRKNQGEFE